MAKITLNSTPLYEHQMAVVNTLKYAEPNSTTIVKSSRQKGKSLVVNNLLLGYSIQNKAQTSILIEPVFSQSRRMYSQIIKACKGIPIIENTNAGDMIITFKNGSEIVFLSAAQGDNIRGNTVTENGLLVYDEGAYIKDDVIYNTLQFADANKAKVLMVSTPAFKQGAFYEFYKNAVERQKGFNLVDFNDFDTSMLLSPEKKEQYKKTLPLPVYLTEIQGEFIDAISSLFGNLNDVCSNSFDYSLPTEVMGIDWGTGDGNDFTSISCFNSIYQMNYLSYFNDVQPTAQIPLIIKAIKQMRPKKIIVEHNSIGSVYGDMLKKEIGKLNIPTSFSFFETTNDSKRNIVENLITKVQERNIQLMDDTMLKLQFSAYSVEPTRTGKITYQGLRGEHDDIVMSTAIALYHLSKQTRYVII